MHDPAGRRRPDELGGFKEVKSAKIPTLNTLSILNSDKIKSPMPTNCLCIYFAKIELSRAKRMRSLKPAGN